MRDMAQSLFTVVVFVGLMAALPFLLRHLQRRRGVALGPLAGAAASTGAASTGNAVSPPSVLSVSRIAVQDVPALPGSEPDTLVEPDVAVSPRDSRVAVAVHELLGLRHLSRVDLIVDAAGTPWFLEVNVLPGLTETSLVPMALDAAGFELGLVYAALAEKAVLDHA